MISFCVFNQKGGSSKTTSALTIADALSRTTIGTGKNKRPARVTIFDADPQKSAYKWESRRLSTDYPRYPVRVEAISQLPSINDWHKKALEALQQLEGIDYLVIDTPPSLDRTELRAALQFADVGIMPFQCHVSNVEALEELVPFLNSIQTQRKTPLITRLLVAKYNLRRSSEREIYDNIEDLSPWPILQTRLKDLVAFSDAHTYHTSLYAFSGSKEAKTTADELAAELIKIAHASTAPSRMESTTEELT
jgi:cellulose biosynthesis protein BcsQ